MSELSTSCFNETSIIAHLRNGIIAAALVCVVVLSALWLVEPPAHTALAEAEATEVASDAPAPAHSDPSPMDSLSSTSTSTPTPTVTASPSLAPTEMPAAVTSVPDDDLPYHVVQPGETLTLIAERHGTSAEELVALNRMANPDLLFVGQRIALPENARVVETATPVSSPTARPIDEMAYPELATADELLRGRWIDVDLSAQRLTAYDASAPVRTMLVSTGLPQTPTPVGQFRIWIKLRYDDMAGLDYYIEDVPFVMYFHEGYGLHGVTWHGNFGHPMSHGCVNLPTEEAEWLYGWADLGTLVNIHE